MAGKRRLGPEDSSVRHDFLDAAERVLSKHGYAAVTSRRVSEEAGVKPQLLYYYFRDMEDLVVATFQRRTSQFLDQLEAALATPTPIRTIWELSSHRDARLISEFMAMANHNEAIRAEIARYSEHANRIQVAAVARSLKRSGVDPAQIPPSVLTFLVASVARNLVAETELGILPNQGEIERFIATMLDRLEPRLLNP